MEDIMMKRLPYLIPLLFLAVLAMPLRASSPIGAIVQESHYDSVRGIITFSVVNISHKDITAFSLQLRVTYADGTGATSESMTDFLPSMISTFEQGHPIASDQGNGAFAPGAIHNQEFPQSQGVSATATVDMVTYADGTADVLNEAAFKQLVLQRKARVLAMQKADELLMKALADPKVDHPSATVAAQVKGLASALQNKNLGTDDPADHEGLGFLEVSRDIANAPQSPTGRSAKEDNYLLALIKTHRNRVSLYLPHTELTKGAQP